MLEKIKEKMFPCTEIISRAIADNCEATDRLIKACSPRDYHGNSLARPRFPELKSGQIVNPR